LQTKIFFLQIAFLVSTNQITVYVAMYEEYDDEMCGLILPYCPEQAAKRHKAAPELSTEVLQTTPIPSPPPTVVPATTPAPSTTTTTFPSPSADDFLMLDTSYYRSPIHIMDFEEIGLHPASLSPRAFGDEVADSPTVDFEEHKTIGDSTSRRYCH
jgi:hypothetical protein